LLKYFSETGNTTDVNISLLDTNIGNNLTSDREIHDILLRLLSKTNEVCNSIMIMSKDHNIMRNGQTISLKLTKEINEGIKKCENKISDLQLKLEQQNGEIERLQQKDVLNTGKIAKLEEIVSKLQATITETVTEVNVNMKNCIQNIEKDIKQTKDTTPNFDPETTIVAINYPKSGNETNETLVQEFQNLFRETMKCKGKILGVKRVGDTGGRNGVLKIQMATVEEKIQILREKYTLKNSRNYSNLYLRSSQPHAQRVMDRNFRTIIDNFPNFPFRMNGSGELIPNNIPGYPRTLDHPSYMRPNNNNIRNHQPNPFMAPNYRFPPPFVPKHQTASQQPNPGPTVAQNASLFDK
jgi:TolA-binding protein